MDHLTERIICCAFNVSNRLGTGFLEKVYENALAHELRLAKLNVKQQSPIQVYYDRVVVGEYFADLLVNEEVIIELKAAKSLDVTHQAQCMNYLRATGLKVSLLMNFGGPRVEIKRIVNGYAECRD